MVEPLITPIHKVGLVLLRDVAGDDPLVCLSQVKAKNPAEQLQVDFGLPKGTRQYLDPADNRWKDARDAATAYRYRDVLEPLSVTLMNEAEQEAGVPKQVFAQAAIRDLGSRLFSSRKNAETYDIQWYVMEANAAMTAAMNPTPPDAHAVQWVPLSQVRAMEEAGKINPCYVSVIEEAALKLRSNQLRPAHFPELDRLSRQDRNRRDVERHGR